MNTKNRNFLVAGFLFAVLVSVAFAARNFQGVLFPGDGTIRLNTGATAGTPASGFATISATDTSLYITDTTGNTFPVGSVFNGGTITNDIVIDNAGAGRIDLLDATGNVDGSFWLGGAVAVIEGNTGVQIWRNGAGIVGFENNWVRPLGARVGAYDLGTSGQPFTNLFLGDDTAQVQLGHDGATDGKLVLSDPNSAVRSLYVATDAAGNEDAYFGVVEASSRAVIDGADGIELWWNGNVRLYVRETQFSPISTSITLGTADRRWGSAHLAPDGLTIYDSSGNADVTLSEDSGRGILNGVSGGQLRTNGVARLAWGSILSVGVDLVPSAATAGTLDLGSTTYEWGDVYTSGTIFLGASQTCSLSEISGFATLDGASGVTFRFNGSNIARVNATGLINITAPGSGTGLGSSANPWENLYLGDGTNAMRLTVDGAGKVAISDPNGTADASIAIIDDAGAERAVIGLGGNAALIEGDAGVRLQITGGDYVQAITGEFGPSVAGTFDLGSGPREWGDFYMQGVLYLGTSQQVEISNTGGVLELNGGTGGGIDLQLLGTTYWQMTSSGHLRPGAAGSYDIGDASREVRHIYTSGTIYLGAGQDCSITNNSGHLELNAATARNVRLQINGVTEFSADETVFIANGGQSLGTDASRWSSGHFDSTGTTAGISLYKTSDGTKVGGVFELSDNVFFAGASAIQFGSTSGTRWGYITASELYPATTGALSLGSATNRWDALHVDAQTADGVILYDDAGNADGKIGIASGLGTILFEAPTGGFTFQPAIGSSNSFNIVNTSIYPSTAGALALGTASNRWGHVYTEGQLFVYDSSGTLHAQYSQTSNGPYINASSGGLMRFAIGGSVSLILGSSSLQTGGNPVDMGTEAFPFRSLNLGDANETRESEVSEVALTESTNTNLMRVTMTADGAVGIRGTTTIYATDGTNEQVRIIQWVAALQSSDGGTTVAGAISTIGEVARTQSGTLTGSMAISNGYIVVSATSSLTQTTLTARTEVTSMDMTNTVNITPQ